MHVVRYSTNQTIQKDSNIYHINKKGLTILKWKKYRRSLKSISYNIKMIRSIIALNMIWFVVDTEIFGKDGNPLVKELKEVYCLNIHLINSEQVCVTNDYCNPWFDEELAVRNLVVQFRKRDVFTLEEFLKADPDFIFRDSCREGILTGRLLRNREKTEEVIAQFRQKGITRDEVDRVGGFEKFPYENFIPKDKFRIDMCEVRTREQLETLYNQMISHWLERNSKPFALSQFEAYRDWGDQILVPAPISVLENQEDVA